MRTGLAALLGILPALILLPVGRPARGAEPSAPPGFNVYLVRQAGGRSFWRGGAPTQATLAALAAAARRRNAPITFIDLRTPPNRDDRSGKGGRLSPTQEQQRVRELGYRYLALSALDPALPARVEAASREGDVYLHCMYGVNRTGFAVGRWAHAVGVSVGRTGLGERDWRQGVAHERARRAARAAGERRKAGD